jgi:anti-sigma factor RsiW
MNCQQSKPLIEPYADGELEAAAIPDLERHIQGCPACASAWRNLQTLKKALKQDSLYFAAPADLRRRIKSELRSTIKTEPRKPAWNWAANWNWLTTTLSGATAVCLALLLVMTLARPSSEQPLAQEIVSGHIRSLMGNHLMDVVSTDQHTVKPWFNGKVDFSPPVKNLETNGFPLIGGRLDYLGSRSVAALVFQRQKHIINLFVWPAKEEDLKAASLAPDQGYNLIHWSEAGMTFWAVSDLNKKELMEFVQDFAAAAQLK